ncbi:MAG TPA: MBL fold metallo-hydrolase [Longimicrobiales bacterium]|nr:MBL fold metallo-hydrolase [Longimicrobiales bacterium]
MLEIRTYVGKGFSQNAYLIWQSDSKDAIALDPGADAPSMVAALESNQLKLQTILLTHAHLDHIEGVAHLKRHADVPIYMHPDDAQFYDNAHVQAAQFGMQVEKLPPVDMQLHDGQQLNLAGITLDVYHVPGHCPGHVIFYVKDAKTAFVGDVVFQGSIGRTDLPGGSYQVLMQSIRDHVMTLPDDTVLYSGHGPETTVGEERKSNPFIAPMYGGSFA